MKDAMRRNIVVVLGLVSLACYFSSRMAAQNSTGTIAGVVKDESGAVVVGATVSVVNLGTNARYSGVTDSIGNYSIRGLPISGYRLIAESAGFKKFETTGIQVQINETARVDPVLQVGAVTDTVQVEASVVHVDTESATLKTVVDQRRIEGLPLNGRDALQLMRLVVGVQLYQGDGVTSDTTYPGVVPVSVNGSRGNTVNYMLDGAQHNDHYTNAPSPMPNPDALAEFSVQTNNFSAEFGRNSGGVVNAVTRSGSNELHGSAFGYLRHYDLNAANFFAPPKDDNPNEKQNDGLKRSQFGATVGGPVYLPRMYNGKNRSFFFFSYQATKVRRQPSTQFNEVLTATERAGDFSGLLPDVVLNDPSTGQPFPGNRIPSTQLSPVAAEFVNNYMPLPTIGERRVVTTTRNNYDDDQYLAKGDQAFGSNNRLSGSVFISKASVPGFLDPTNYYQLTVQSKWRNTNVMITDTHTFGPSLTNAATFGYTRTTAGDAPILPAKSWADMGSKITQDTTTQIRLLFQGPLSDFNTRETETFKRREFQGSDILRWIRNRHQISLGGEYGYGIGDNTGNFKANGRFYFANDAGFSGYAPADFLLGKFSEFAQSLGEFKQARFRRLGLFFQDSIRLTNRITLDGGLRWEPFFPYTDELGRLVGWNPGQQSSRFVNAPKGILYAGDPGIPQGVYAIAWKNFAPRAGLAIDLTGDGRTSLRAGYGIFYDQPDTISTNAQANQAPFGTTVDFYGSSVNSMSDPYAGFPGGNPFTAVGNSAFGTEALNPKKDATFILPSAVVAYNMNMRNPYNQAWNLTLEREVTSGFVVRVSYAGSKGTSLLSGRDINAPLPNASATTSTTNERRPLYPVYNGITLLESAGLSNFHSLQLTGEKRFSHGFSILANYMWSKTIDDNLGSANKGNSVSVTNPLNQKFDRGLADFDKASVFNLSALWELPVKLHNRVGNAVLGRWSLATIVALQSGFPFTVVSGADNARTGQDGQRADLVGNPYLSGSRSKAERLDAWLNPAAFVANAMGTYGTLGRNTFRGPGRANVDLALHKRFPIREPLHLEFRAEAFNAFNRANFSNPSSDLSGSNFLRITEAGDPRILQFALRLAW